MGEVTGFTKERMQAIEDEAIVGASLDGDDLILVRHDGTTIDVGSVRGPQGIQGPGGADIVDLMELLSPVGAMQPFGGAAEPTGWLICDGRSLLRTDYASLFSAIGVAYGSVDSTHFTIPDLRLKVPIGKTVTGTGSTLGVSGGNKDAIIVSHQHGIGGDGDHAHTGSGNTISYDTGGIEGLVLKSWSDPMGGVSGTPTKIEGQGTTNAGSHSHGGVTGSTGGSATDANLPPYAVVNWIIRY